MTAQQTTLSETGALNRELSQFFTPRDLALRVWRWARLPTGDAPLVVLEPSAGRGALVEHVIAAEQKCIAYEIDPVNADALATRWAAEVRHGWLDVYERDFLAACEAGDVATIDLALLNPPFENGRDVAFIAACCKLAPRAVAICQARIVHSQGRAEFWRWHDITREAILSARPRFGGDQGGKTDFVVLDISRRSRARLQGEATACAKEWWS